MALDGCEWIGDGVFFRLLRCLSWEVGKTLFWWRRSVFFRVETLKVEDGSSSTHFLSTSKLLGSTSPLSSPQTDLKNWTKTMPELDKTRSRLGEC